MLKRSYVRAYIAMNAVAVVVFIVLFFMDSSTTLWQGCFWIAWVMLIISEIISFRFFRCPHCGKGVPLQWSKNGPRVCNKCGQVLEYDK